MKKILFILCVALSLPLVSSARPRPSVPPPVPPPVPGAQPALRTPAQPLLRTPAQPSLRTPGGCVGACLEGIQTFANAIQTLSSETRNYVNGVTSSVTNVGLLVRTMFAKLPSAFAKLEKRFTPARARRILGAIGHAILLAKAESWGPEALRNLGRFVHKIATEGVTPEISDQVAAVEINCDPNATALAFRP